jgi:hypothetical protein
MIGFIVGLVANIAVSLAPTINEMVPAATAADLRAYWEKLSEGDNWLLNQMPSLN